MNSEFLHMQTMIRQNDPCKSQPMKQSLFRTFFSLFIYAIYTRCRRKSSLMNRKALHELTTHWIVNHFQLLARWQWMSTSTATNIIVPKNFTSSISFIYVEYLTILILCIFPNISSPLPAFSFVLSFMSKTSKRQRPSGYFFQLR